MLAPCDLLGEACTAKPRPDHCLAGRGVDEGRTAGSLAPVGAGPSATGYSLRCYQILTTPLPCQFSEQIEGMSPRAFVSVTTIQAKRKSALDDLVKRMCDTGTLNRVWMSDITNLLTGEGCSYLCVVRDGHSRRVLG